MKKYTYNDFKTLYFRKSRLTAALQMLIDLVSGASVLIRPYMEDENGCYNEGKTLNLIDEFQYFLKNMQYYEHKIALQKSNPFYFYRTNLM